MCYCSMEYSQSYQFNMNILHIQHMYKYIVDCKVRLYLVYVKIVLGKALFYAITKPH